jgi:excisionase family DNA binding protein
MSAVNSNQPRRVNYVDAAAFLGIKVTTLRSMVHRKQVPHIRLGPQLVVFDLDVLSEWLRGCSVEPTSQTA